MLSRPRCRGVSDQRLQTLGRGAVAGILCIGDAVQRPGGPSREAPGRIDVAPRALTAGRPDPPVRGVPAECLVLKRQVVNDRLPGTSRSKPQNTVRGTPEARAAPPFFERRVWRTCGNFGFRQASMSRGVEVRGSEQLGLFD